MATSKPISTISYNSPEFLVARLEALASAGAFSSWFFIEHLAEAKDETPGKAHIHLLICPNKRIDLVKLQQEFKEVQPKGKPLGVMPFRNAKVNDWILYALHDTDYLISKGLKREYRYLPEQMICSDADYFMALLCEARQELLTTPQRAIKEAVLNSESFEQLLDSGRIGINQVHNSAIMYDALKRYYFNPVPTALDDGLWFTLEQPTPFEMEDENK